MRPPASRPRAAAALRVAALKVAALQAVVLVALLPHRQATPGPGHFRRRLNLVR
jgi:hypothetical protein